jgi:hypothetical protein
MPIVGRGAEAAGAVLVALVSIEVGRWAASGSLRMLSLVVGAIAAPLLAQVPVERLTRLLILVLPLPLFFRGLNVSLTPLLVCAAWLAWLGARARGHRASSTVATRHKLLCVALALPPLLGLYETQVTSTELAAVGRRLVGIGIFALCVVTIRDRHAVGKAWDAVVGSAAVVISITLLELTMPSLQIPGLVSNVGAIQANVYGLASNLRVGGPIGDYELMGEFCALAGTAAAFSAFRMRRHLPFHALVWCGCFVGVALTSTRSALLILAAGTLVAVGPALRRLRLSTLALMAAASIGVAVAVLEVQARYSSGFVFERVSNSTTSGGLLRILDRATVWPFFWHNRPHGGGLLVGVGPAFDLTRWQSFPHSLPLTLLYTGGLFGVVVFAVLVYVLMRDTLAERAGIAQQHASLALTCLVLFALNEIKIEFTRVENYEWWVWALLGVCAATGARRGTQL